MDKNKNLEVITGDGSNLDISPVYDHLNVPVSKSADKKPKNIVIPANHKKNKCQKNAKTTKNKNIK